MNYNPKIHHRHSIRLKGYDYSQAGLYFITICVQDRKCLFGKIAVGADLCVCPTDLCVCPTDLCVCPTDLCVCPKIILNDAGHMVEKWYHELENKFPDKKFHEMVIMPNHFHCIIENVVPVGADLCVCPNNQQVCPNDVKHSSEIATWRDKKSVVGEHNVLGEHIGSPLQRVVQWFKTMTTNEYIRGVKQHGDRKSVV